MITYELLKKEIRSKKTIIVTDYSDYVWNRGTDGGRYLYETKYVHKGTKYLQYHYTSSDFQYCDICATFTVGCKCRESDRTSFYREELIVYLEWIYNQEPEGILINP